jgi:phosphatidylglycerol:prolipoprotein diacylglycerol transferase
VAGPRETISIVLNQANDMTVYPLIIHLGSFMITGFGIMMMVGFLMAGWVIQKDLRRRGFGPVYAEHIIVAGVVGGVLGAKLWFVALYQDPAQLFSRGGLVWYGGLIGGAVAVLFNGWRKHVPTRLTLELSAPALALGHSLGRLGCFLIQDDYGVPTSLPWAMRFPEGYPPTTAAALQRFGVEVPANVAPTDVLAVHPTQLYEVVALMFIFWLLWRLKTHNRAMGWLFGLYLVAAGVERFLIELLRAKDDRFLGPLTLAQAASVVVLVLGVALMARWQQKDDFEIPKEATVLTEGTVGSG